MITHYENKLFEMQTLGQYGSLLENLIDSDEFSKLEDDEQRYINNLLRHYKDDIKVPQDFYIRYSKLKINLI
ncbi:MAG: carboxypeptidase M32 [Bacilli bacterium]|nr:carboxypeptidase M32 [Bacilli bacterium]MCI9434438.1 carboxypeptidase M32 [Bacilli bacterium]